MMIQMASSKSVNASSFSSVIIGSHDFGGLIDRDGLDTPALIALPIEGIKLSHLVTDLCQVVNNALQRSTNMT